MGSKPANEEKKRGLQAMHDVPGHFYPVKSFSIAFSSLSCRLFIEQA